MADLQFTREVVDKHFKRLRGQLFTLTECSLPGPQQEAFKRQIKMFTQNAWHGIILDAGLPANDTGGAVEVVVVESATRVIEVLDTSNRE